MTQLLDLHRLHPDILDYVRSLKPGVHPLRPTTEKKLRAWVGLSPGEQLGMAEKEVQGLAEYRQKRARTQRGA